MDGFAAPPHLTRIGCVDPRDALDQDRLPRAVVTGERRYLTGGDVEIDIGERTDRSEVLADTAET
jgi:hypothetical protein